MRQFSKWMTVPAILVALIVVLFLARCAGAQRSETGEDRDAGPDVAVIDDVRAVAGDRWDMEEAVARARAEEAALLRERAGVRETRIDPHAELEARMARAIIQEQPWYTKRPRMAKRLARIIMDAALEHGQSPWIALAIAYKESSLSPGVGRLKVTGDLGEEGYFQIMPRSYPMRACGKGRSMGNARANADTAMCFLGVVQGMCDTDDPWVYVNAYGINVSRHGCPTSEQGHGLRPARRAREILCRMVGDEECGEIWPT